MPDKCQLTLLCHFSECTLSVSRFVLMFQRLCHKIAEWVSRSCFKCISGIISKLLVSQGKGYSGGQEKMLRRALGGNTHILTRITSIYFKSILIQSISQFSHICKYLLCISATCLIFQVFNIYIYQCLYLQVCGAGRGTCTAWSSSSTSTPS